ncbi:MAG: DDE-type integrase/transposase/recombinase, partial [Pyrinomonadaceae bacterium]|nr:DDE-type integrase/transposase/recombinase [Pyrinomonadaceae bacterium]
DGCVVARSNEAKALGITMGAPIHKVQDLVDRNGVEVLSSNYTLYGDMSHRVMKTLEEFTPDVEVYSIDEAFMNLAADHRRLPFSISVDKNAAYPDAFAASQEQKVLPLDCKLRRTKYLNNVIEQDHRFVKKRVRAAQCFKSFTTAERTLSGVEAVNMMRKGQVKRLSGKDAQAKFVQILFQVAALRSTTSRLYLLTINLCNTTGGSPRDCPARSSLQLLCSKASINLLS